MLTAWSFKEERRTPAAASLTSTQTVHWEHYALSKWDQNNHYPYYRFYGFLIIVIVMPLILSLPLQERQIFATIPSKVTSLQDNKWCVSGSKSEDPSMY